MRSDPYMTQPSYVPQADRDDIFDEVTPEVASETNWKNPTNRAYALELYEGTQATPGRRPKTELERRGIVRFVIKPGDTRAIPSKYDRAIQDVRDGIIVGGLGPHLINTGTQERPILHRALDDLDAQKRAAMHRSNELELEAATRKAELETTQSELAALKAKLAERDERDPRRPRAMRAR